MVQLSIRLLPQNAQAQLIINAMYYRRLISDTFIRCWKPVHKLWQIMCFSFDWQDLERQKHTCSVLQHKQEEMKEGIRQRDELIEVEPRT